MTSGELQRGAEPPSHSTLEETHGSGFSLGANVKHTLYGSAVGFPSLRWHP